MKKFLGLLRNNMDFDKELDNLIDKCCESDDPIKMGWMEIIDRYQSEKDVLKRYEVELQVNDNLNDYWESKNPTFDYEEAYYSTFR